MERRCLSAWVMIIRDERLVCGKFAPWSDGPKVAVHVESREQNFSVFNFSMVSLQDFRPIAVNGHFYKSRLIVAVRLLNFVF